MGNARIASGMNTKFTNDKYADIYFVYGFSGENAWAGVEKGEEFLFQTTPPKWCGIQHRTSTTERRRNTRQKYKKARNAAMQLQTIRGNKKEATWFADNFH
jgi:hypothetical protein